MPAHVSHIAPATGVRDTGSPGLRSDAASNRRRVLDAARALFVSRGLDVPMATIARHAGVGVATLYRRFPTREALVAEVFSDEFTACAAIVDDALADDDAWRAFRRIIETVCASQTQDREFNDALLSSFPDSAGFERELPRIEEGFAEVVRRAKAAGRLREDFDVSDLSLVFLANRGVIGDATTAPAASRRLVAHLLRSFEAGRAEPARPLPPPAPLGLGRLPRTAGG
ncbi:TetR family transcriptional regulator [Streptomyces sp. SID8361]|uniref:TetR/AcrR family transcriptional regulator n=1 Tax=Streptomyces TaxID=1883 RepID=UPI000B85C433|nr:TetR/AcrR family transcriptional regulator [Streptomyces sp. MnatMP-M27]MYU19056.1 TetR family transcriptional regulator [Streptomyces sp. SID8361]WPB95284.1 helix-turn-helix domain-containing protein [Streptomyces malaysiensis]